MKSTFSFLGVFLLFLSGIFAQEGTLDSTFNSVGFTTTNGYYGSKVVEAIQSDGKIVVAGKNSSNQRVVLRYNTDGSLDATFNGTGIVTTSSANGFLDATSVLIQPDGKIITVGYYFNAGMSQHISLIRYNSDGSLDNTFGTAGIATTDVGSYQDRVGKAVLQSDGKIVVSAYALDSWTGVYTFLVLRYTATGALDATFNTTGYKNIDLGCSNFGSYNMLPSCGVTLQSDGKILFAGAYGTSETTRDMICIRLTSNGTLDSTFNSVAYKTLDLSGNEDWANDVAVDNSGNIILAGKRYYYAALARLNSAGAVDASFGNSGSTYFDLGTSAYCNLQQITILPNNKILVGGMAYIGSYNIGVARLNSNGTLDNTFGTGGKVNCGFLGTSQVDGYGHVVQSDGKIVVCGGYNQAQFAVMRFKQKAFPVVSAYPTASAITYGETLASSTLSGGTVSVAGTWSFDSPSVSTPVGTYGAAITFTPADAVTYCTMPGTAAVVTNPKELTVSGATAQNKPYDGTTDAVISGAALQGVVGTDDVVLNASTTGVFAQSSIGTGISVSTSMSISGTDIANYTFTQPTGFSADITAKELTVISAAAQNKVYDATTDAVISGATLQGVVGTEDVVLNNYSTGTFAQSSIGTGIAVSTSMTVTGADIANYTLTQPTLSADITAKELTVTGAMAADKIYDGTTDATISGATLQGVIGTEDVTLDVVMTGVFAQKDTGTAISVTSTLSLSGADIANYSLTQPTGLSADITAKELTVTSAVADNKIYDGTTDATISGAALQGVVGTEDVTLDVAMAGVFAQKDTGTAISVTSALALAGADIANYTLTQPTGLSADIAAREVFIGGSFDVSDKQYDGNTSATIVNNNLTLIDTIWGDNVSLTNVVAEFVSAAQGNNVNVVIASAELAGTDAPNYILLLTGSPTTQADITSGVGIDAYSDDALTVWPNPAIEFINIGYTGIITSLRMMNSNGQLVYSSSENNSRLINVSGFEPGLYFIQIQTENGDVLSGKFLKN